MTSDDKSDSSNSSHGKLSIDVAKSRIQDWVTIGQFCEHFPNIPEKTIRWQITSRYRNGLAPYVQVIGKRLFLSIEKSARAHSAIFFAKPV